MGIIEMDISNPETSNEKDLPWFLEGEETLVGFIRHVRNEQQKQQHTQNLIFNICTDPNKDISIEDLFSGFEKYFGFVLEDASKKDIIERLDDYLNKESEKTAKILGARIRTSFQIGLIIAMTYYAFDSFKEYREEGVSNENSLIK